MWILGGIVWVLWLLSQGSGWCLGAVDEAKLAIAAASAVRVVATLPGMVWCLMYINVVCCLVFGGYARRLSQQVEVLVQYRQRFHGALLCSFSLFIFY